MYRSAHTQSKLCYRPLAMEYAVKLTEVLTIICAYSNMGRRELPACVRLRAVSPVACVGRGGEGAAMQADFYWHQANIW